MSIFNNHPTIADFKKNEVKTLEFISTRGLLRSFNDLAEAISLAYYDYRGRLNKPHDFKFHTEFEMEVEGSPHKVFVGANVIGEYSLCSYFFAIAGKDNDMKKVIRKFHFDYALPSAGVTRQPVPIYHLQYGGALTQEMETGGMSDEKLDHWLSLPRLNFAPVNLAILFDILFCELRVEQTHEIVESDEWRTLIFDNEKFLSRHYFNNISTHVNSQNYKKGKLIRDYCYGTN